MPWRVPRGPVGPGLPHGVTSDENSPSAISPDGAWVSYRDDTAGRVHIKKVDGSASHDFPQSWGPAGSGVTIKKSRSGFSQDSRYLIYETGNTLRFCRLNDWGSDAEYLSNDHPSSSGGATVQEQLYAPTSYVTPDGEERIMFSAGNHNPVLVSVVWNPSSPPGHLTFFSDSDIRLPDLNAGGSGSGSSTDEDDYPCITWDGRQLVLNRSPFSDGETEDVLDQELWTVQWNTSQSNFVGPPQRVVMDNVRRAVWIP